MSKTIQVSDRAQSRLLAFPKPNLQAANDLIHKTIGSQERLYGLTKSAQLANA